MRLHAAALVLAAAAIGLATPHVAAAQQPSPGNFLPAGAPAPEISFTGATRYGLLAEPVRLSDYRGQTVVLAFFFRARSPG
jgi:thioredoxin-dependent peroxiredoxin